MLQMCTRASFNQHLYINQEYSHGIGRHFMLGTCHWGLDIGFANDTNYVEMFPPLYFRYLSVAVLSIFLCCSTLFTCLFMCSLIKCPLFVLGNRVPTIGTICTTFRHWQPQINSTNEIEIRPWTFRSLFPMHCTCFNPSIGLLTDLGYYLYF